MRGYPMRGYPKGGCYVEYYLTRGYPTMGEISYPRVTGA